MINIAAHPEFRNVELLKHAAQTALEHQSADPDADMSIVLTGDEKLRELNRDYLGIDAATDVLSFPASESDPETGARYLGDILISVPRAAEQAKTTGHNVQDELQLLVVHGALHLLGHDHAEAEEKTRMWTAQAEVLERLGLGHIRVREE